MRQYQTTPTMLAGRLGTQEEIVSPDANLVKQLHRLLNMVPEDIALSIDHTVAELVRFKNPNRQRYAEIQPPEQS